MSKSGKYKGYGSTPKGPQSNFLSPESSVQGAKGDLTHKAISKIGPDRPSQGSKGASSGTTKGPATDAMQKKTGL